MNKQLSKNIRHLAHLDIPGGGQIVVSGHYAYIGHMKPPHGTTIIDIADPEQPKVITSIDAGSPHSHSHKVRVIGDIMITNVEQDQRHVLRKGQRLEQVRAQLGQQLGHQPKAAELATALGVKEADIPLIEAANERGYDEGGFKVWDISNKARPQLLSYQHTFGFGVHRFDMDSRYAYISTEMEGYVGNILVIYDISQPDQVTEVSRWWLPGQHVAGGEKPDWPGYSHRLHHAMRVGDELWAAVWHAGFRVIDISDINKPTTVGAYSYHPWVVEPTHTVLPAGQYFDQRRIAVVCDEEHEHRHGQPHAGLWIFDVTELDNIQPLSTFHVSEMDSPWARGSGRFGMHQFREKIDNNLVYCAWFSGGLRIVDIANPSQPEEVAFFIPEPDAEQPSPQSNDVDVDDRGLIYLLDRNVGLDILEYTA